MRCHRSSSRASRQRRSEDPPPDLTPGRDRGRDSLARRRDASPARLLPLQARLRLAPAAARSTPPTRTSPSSATAGYDVEHYDLGITFCRRHACLMATLGSRRRATAALRSFHLDLTGLTVNRVDVDGQARALHAPRRRARHPAACRAREGRAVPRPSALLGNSGDGHDPWLGRAGRVDRDERRRDHAERARRREPLVPGQRSSLRQGDVHVPHHGP